MHRFLLVLLPLAAFSAASSGSPRDANSIYDGCGSSKECYGYFSNSCVGSMVGTI